MDESANKEPGKRRSAANSRVVAIAIDTAGTKPRPWMPYRYSAGGTPASLRVTWFSHEARILMFGKVSEPGMISVLLLAIGIALQDHRLHVVVLALPGNGAKGPERPHLTGQQRFDNHARPAASILSIGPRSSARRRGQSSWHNSDKARCRY